MIELIEQFILETFHINIDAQVKLLQSLLILLVVIIVRYFLLRIVHKRFHDDPRQLYNWRKVTEYTIVIIALVLIGRVWIASLHSILTYLGILSAGVAIALQDLLVSLAGWLFIIWRRPFSVGDRIQMGEHTGDVIDTRLFQFTLLEVTTDIEIEQSTGRLVHIPNGNIFKEVFVNYTQGLPYLWDEIPVMVTFESDWEKAKAILIDIAEQYAPTITKRDIRRAQARTPRFVFSYNNLTPIVYTHVASSGVMLTIRSLIYPRDRRRHRQEVWEAILREFALHYDIDFAYETQREYVHYREHKKPPVTPATGQRDQSDKIANPQVEKIAGEQSGKVVE